MKPKKDRPRKAVSFTKFRRIQLTALDSLMLMEAFGSLHPDIQLRVYALRSALIEARFRDAVDLSKAITEQQYGDAESFRLVQQIANLVRKVPYTGPDFDPRGKAISSFLDAEEECRATNKALRPLVAFMEGRGAGWILDPEEARMFALLDRARVHVRRVLGDEPPLSELSCRFSNGSVQGCSGNATHVAAKLLAETWTVTPGCLGYARAFTECNPYMWEALFGFSHEQYGTEDFRAAFANKVDVVEHDIIDFVLKTADTHRSIGKQALLNAFIQNAVGDHMRDLLLVRAQIDIRTAQDRVNGPLARLGSSCEGHPFATLDLSAASDTIAIQFVKLLVPPAWFSFLDTIRSPSYSLDGKTERYEKFVAMGNGFCFPLETLLFWSLVQAVYDLNVIPDRTCAVYGDDIIVYQCTALELTELLDVCGFKLNSAKSFVLGPFRESCGQDYFEGLSVRPFTLDSIIEEWGDVFHMINSLCYRGFSSVAQSLHSQVPARMFYVRRGRGASNTAIEVDSDTFLNSKHVRWNRDSWCYEHKELITVPVLDGKSYDTTRVGMYSALIGHQSDEYVPSYALRYSTKTFPRWILGDGISAFADDRHWEVPEGIVRRARTRAHYREVTRRLGN